VRRASARNSFKELVCEAYKRNAGQTLLSLYSGKAFKRCRYARFSAHVVERQIKEEPMVVLIFMQPPLTNDKIMENSRNKPNQAGDAKRQSSQDNRIGTIRSGNASNPEQAGKTDKMKPRTSGSNEMATGSPVTSGEHKHSGSTNGTSAERESGMSPSDKNLASQDAEAVRRSVREDVKNDTGEPTGSIHGRDGDIKSVSDEFDDTAEESR
jgi:hypothetical protein